MQWNGHKIEVVSLGVGDNPSLTQLAIAALASAEVIIGAEHHFTTIDNLLVKNEHAIKILFPSPFGLLNQVLEQYKKYSIVVLASGDALFYGIGSWLVTNLGQQHLVFYPNVSSMQVAFQRIGLAWQDAVVHSLHGRPLNTLSSRLRKGATLGLFTDALATPAAIAERLCIQGFSESEMWVCESLGTANEKITHCKANEIQQTAFSSLTICVVKCIGHNECFIGTAGIADECFETGAEPGKGMITKREVRLAILSLMECHPNDVAWDIGAGCGSVSIEWALQNKSGTIYAVESNQQRMDYLKINNHKFGTELNLKTVLGIAPECCTGLPVPDVIFVGGNGGNLAALLEFGFSSLQPGGRLVASAVMPESIHVLHEFARKYQLQKGELIKIQVSKANSLSGINDLKELKPITVLKVVKN